MEIKGIDHIAVNTQDIEQSLTFYTGVLGFEVLESVEMDGFAITYLALPGGGRLELFDYYGRNVRVPVEESQVGYRHVALEVDDVDAFERVLREKGVPIVLPATDLPKLNARVLLCTDPDGVVWELCTEL
jgi:catechol 2,3-dioxygenase-like lactoylglutathione lyase family enzyme